MSRAEQAPAPQPSFVSRSFEKWSRVASSIPRTAALSMVGPGLLIVLGYLFWINYGAKKIDHSLYGLIPENVILTPRPTWIRVSNVAQEVFQGSMLGNISMQDREACSTIAEAFARHPWIDRVHRVTKMAGNQVKVDVEFRRPFALVYCEKDPNRKPTSITNTSTQPTAASDYVEYLLVDPNGINLPSQDSNQDDVYNYFQVYCPNVSAKGQIGLAFEDTRVLNALKICSALEDMRVQFGIEHVNVLAETSGHLHTRWVYQVGLKGGEAIIEWGHAPGEETQGEDDVKTKIAKIRARFGGQSNAHAPTH